MFWIHVDGIHWSNVLKIINPNYWSNIWLPLELNNSIMSSSAMPLRFLSSRWIWDNTRKNDAWFIIKFYFTFASFKCLLFYFSHFPIEHFGKYIGCHYLVASLSGLVGFAFQYLIHHHMNSNPFYVSKYNKHRKDQPR